MAANSNVLINAIKDGTFPDSEDVLSTQINSTSIPAVLKDISQARTALENEIREISKSEAEDVDSWIAQAKKVQHDIERCKAEARQIVEEHERLETLRREKDEARKKTHLLEEEIIYNETLEQQIKQVNHISEAFTSVDAQIRHGQFDRAAQALQPMRDSIETIRGSDTRHMLKEVYDGLERSTKEGLLKLAHHAVEVRKTKDSISIEVDRPPVTAQHRDGSSTQTVSPTLTFEQVVNSLRLINSLEELMTGVVKKIDTALQPHLHKRAVQRLSKAHNLDDCLVLSLTVDEVHTTEQVGAIRALILYLQQRLPISLRETILSRVLGSTVPELMANILDPAIPVHLEDLSQFRAIESEVGSLIDTLQTCERSQHEAMTSWYNQIPQAWLRKKCVYSLEEIRQIFRRSSPVTRQVERIEQQATESEPQPSTAAVAQAQAEAEDDWSAWDNDNDEHESSGKEQITTPTTSQATGEDEPDAWGFDDDTEPKTNQHVQTAPAGISSNAEIKREEDDGDAWGWGDDEDTSPAKSKPVSPVASRTNGLPLLKKRNSPVARVTQRAIQPQIQTTELRELYTITSIPEDILSVLHDHRTTIESVLASPSAYFSQTTPNCNIDLQNSLTETLTQILTLFRALAPSQYTSPVLQLTHMHLYNDILYLVSQISTSDFKASSTDTHKLTAFATQTYTTEISQQRQILLDLLDTAQSFTSCTREPYASSCETAIDSTTDYLRSLYAQWQPILGASHLHQALGSLLSSIISKIILDILDMEDISDPESKKLNEFSERIASLSVLFAPLPGTQPGEESTSSVALFVPNYIRFQYLMQVLTGNLKDIEYLWTEAGLSLEFSREEVIDLIKALFSDSARRKEVIGVIRR